MEDIYSDDQCLIEWNEDGCINYKVIPKNTLQEFVLNRFKRKGVDPTGFVRWDNPQRVEVGIEIIQPKVTR